MSQGNVILEKIVLNETEMFRNAEGEVCEVDVRGDRTRKGTYFKVKDIGKVFGVNRLDNDISSKRSAYNRCEHYIRLTDDNIISNTNDGNYYFTSKGLYMWLFKAEGVKAEHYINWMMDTLFTVQFGTQEEKEELVGVSRQELASGLKLCVNKISGLYLIKLGTVKQLRDVMDLGDEQDDKDLVCKFGYSKDIQKRFYQHDNNLAKELDNGSLELLFYSAIQEPHLAHAEAKLHDFFELVKTDFNGHRELVILSKADLKMTKAKYLTIADGYTTTDDTEITELKEKVQKLRIQKRYIAKEWRKAMMTLGYVQQTLADMGC
jgi:hypothetical protein